MSILIFKVVKFIFQCIQFFKPESTGSVQTKFRKFEDLTTSIHKSGEKLMIFNLEGALLKSHSFFPYFMLVAFEAGGILRALVLLLLYPIIRMVGEKKGLKIMVFISFLGVRREKIQYVGCVLHKFLLEGIGSEGFDVVMSCKRKMAVTELPRVMVDDFLREYIGVEDVFGREIKACNGFFLGLMEDREVHEIAANPLAVYGANVVGLSSFRNSIYHQLSSYCKDVYLVTEEEKSSWKFLPREKYPRHLIFHDGRLAFRPTPTATLVMFMWLPLGLFLFVIRIMAGLLSYKLCIPFIAMTGMINTLAQTKDSHNSIKFQAKSRNVLYVCNHRTLMDPVYLSGLLMKPVTAVTYSLSRFSEVISPIKTARLTRDREKDSQTMEDLLTQGDLVICPEGTTCREPFLLRFSPLFAEISDEIVPVAIDVKVSMFYGSTASGIKCLDSAFHLMNPYPTYSVKILRKLLPSETCKGGGKSQFEVANWVQKEIANALGFTCTNLTRKDKYMILASNTGTE